MQTQVAQHADTPVTRRRLLAFVGWGSFAAFWGSIALATARFFFPRMSPGLRPCRYTGP